MNRVDSCGGVIGVSWAAVAVWILLVTIGSSLAFGPLEDHLPELIAPALILAYIGLPIALFLHLVLAAVWLLRKRPRYPWALGVFTVIEVGVVLVVYLKTISGWHFA